MRCRWYEWWEKSGFFVADPESKKPPFVIVSFLDRSFFDSQFFEMNNFVVV